MHRLDDFNGCIWIYTKRGYNYTKEKCCIYIYIFLGENLLEFLFFQRIRFIFPFSMLSKRCCIVWTILMDVYGYIQKEVIIIQRRSVVYLYIYIFLGENLFEFLFFRFIFLFSMVFKRCCIVWTMILMDILYTKKRLYKGEVLYIYISRWKFVRVFIFPIYFPFLDGF